MYGLCEETKGSKREGTCVKQWVSHTQSGIGGTYYASNAAWQWEKEKFKIVSSYKTKNVSRDGMLELIGVYKDGIFYLQTLQDLMNVAYVVIKYRLHLRWQQKWQQN